MKRLLMIKALALIVAVIAMSASVSSCKKTVEVIVHDTTTIPVADTTFLMVAANWNAYNYVNNGLLTPGPTTYSTTAEGVKFIGQTYRFGSRLQTKQEVRFAGKTIYYKWKMNNGGQFGTVAPVIKYDPFTDEGAPDVQGVQLDFFSTAPYAGFTVIQNDTWYYTRVAPVAGTDNYIVKTCTGNYDNKGGTAISTRTIPLYTKSGYVAFALGDVYGGTNAYAVLAECKIAAN